MKKKILNVLALICISTVAFAQQKKDSIKRMERPVDIGFVYPISTNGRHAALYSNKVSIQAIAGVSGTVTDCAVAGIANIVRENNNGAALAGILNITGNNMKGVQIAGITNIVSNEAEGLQVAGLFNQSAESKGMQVAGIGNITRKQSKAVQLAGVFNGASDIHTQISGLINTAEKVSGVQISGLINIADSSDYAIGFINLIKNGEKSFGISTDENLNTLFSFYSGGKVMYGIAGLGYNLQNDNHLYESQLGIGAHILSGSSFRLNAEALQLVQTDFKNGHSFKYTLQLLPEIKISRHLKLFAGPTANLVLDYSHEKMSSMVNNYIWTTSGKSSHFIGSYFGITGGLKFTL